MKKHISTSVWSAQHPNAGPNIQLSVFCILPKNLSLGFRLLRLRASEYPDFNPVDHSMIWHMFMNLITDKSENWIVTVYSGDLKCELVCILNGQKEVGLQMVWISNGIRNPEAQQFEILTNCCHFVKKLRSGQYRPDYAWVLMSGVNMICFWKGPLS